MRDIANKFVGGVEQVDAKVKGRSRGLSLRAVLIGLVGVALISTIEPYNQNVFENTMLIGNHLPISVLFLILLLVLVANPILTLLPKSTSLLDSARLAVLWGCLLPVSFWCWHGPLEIGERAKSEDGLSGPVVALVWILTGVGLLGAGVVGRLVGRRYATSAAGAKAGGVAGQTMRVGVLAVLCLVPVLLAPLWAAWLGAEAGEQVVDSIVFCRFVAGTAILFVLSWPVAWGLRKIEPFSPAELVVSMTMMLVACTVIWSGFHRLWAHQLVAPFYHLQTYPRWAPFVKAIPAWLVPSSDPQNREIVYNFYAADGAVPWWSWAVTALHWAPFLLAIFMGSFFLMSVFRRQWEEAEKLSFPLAEIALETIRPPSPGHVLNDMFRSKLFWWSAGTVIVLQLLYGLHVYFPEFPEIVFKYDLHAALEKPPWRHLPSYIKAKDAFFAVVGVTFFLSTEMSFSLWGFVVILAVVEMIGKNFQFPIHESYDDHQIGAYIAYGTAIIWVARRHLAAVFRSIWNKAAVPDSKGHISERFAAIGFLFSFVVAVVWLSFAGIPVHVAVLVALVVFLLLLVIGRVVAESGLLYVQYNCWPHIFAQSTFPQLLTPQTHALIHFTTIAPTMDQREGIMPYLFNSGRMADGVGHLGRKRGLFCWWIVALLLAFMLAGAAQLHIVYDRGAINGDEWSGRMLPERTYNSSADFADLLQQPAEKIHAERVKHGTHVAMGASIVLVLCFLRYRFLSWPLHPVGFVMANTMPMQVFWLSIMIGWLCKTLVMRIGGVPTYRKLKPLFFGLIVGTTFTSVFWIMVKIASYSAGQQGKAILFLPS